jgi:hypothetical protein
MDQGVYSLTTPALMTTSKTPLLIFAILLALTGCANRLGPDAVQGKPSNKCPQLAAPQRLPAEYHRIHRIPRINPWFLGLPESW